MVAAVMIDTDAAFLEAWTRLRPSAQSARRRPHLIQGLAELILGPDSERHRWDHAVAGLLRAAAASGRPEVLFGCTDCGCEIEVALPVTELLAVNDATPHQLPGPGSEADAAVTVGDVVALSAMDPDAARDFAAERWPADLDDDFPMLAPTLATPCPECGSEQEIVIDVVGLAWAAIEDRAVLLVDDVVELALAFGWSEREVLAVPGDRRRLYREMVAGRG